MRGSRAGRFTLSGRLGRPVPWEGPVVRPTLPFSRWHVKCSGAEPVQGGSTMLTVTLLLVLVAFGITIASALGKAPLWIAVLLIVLVQLHSLAGVPLSYVDFAQAQT